LVQYKLNPELLVQRLKIRGEGSKSWDLAMVRVTNLTVMVLIPAVAGLDIGRFLWSSLDVSYAVVGLVLFVFSVVIVNWAMSVNQHFEPSVRIQRDRGHRVVASGPYRIVRHPGYSGGILNTLSIILIIGSLYALLPAGIYVGLMVVRTWLEDRTLQKELDGYSEYAEHTRYRLVPFIW